VSEERAGAVDAVDTLGALPAVLDEFEIVRRVGAGAMGRVYEARGPDGRRLALKTLPGAHPGEVARFKGEFRRFADLAHPHLVALDRFVEQDDRACWFTMEYVDGVRFDTWTGVGEDLDVGRLRAALPGLVRGVRAIHAAGLLHRDLKPGNVLVTPAGRVVVVDFGLAVPAGRADDEAEASVRSLRQSEAAGTPRYMAPEQGLGAAPAPPADWYALGVILYLLLTGRAPYSDPHPLLLLKQKLGGKAPRPARGPADLADLATALLHPRPRARPTGDAIAAAVGIVERDPWARPRRRVPGGGEAFEGRADELFTLHSAFRRAGRGEAVLQCVAGPSGVGKTALVERFLNDVRTRDRALVLSARCRAHESIPYKGFDAVVEALAGWLARLPDSTASALLPRRAAEAAAVFPVLKAARAVAVAAASATLPPEPAEVRRRAFRGLRELLGRIAEQRPTVLCIDDVQWGDADSARLLIELLAPPDAPPMLVLATWRSEEADGSPMIEELRRPRRDRGPAPVMDLGPLPRADAVRLARGLLGPAGDAARAESIATESGGSPFLLEQLVEDALLTPDARAEGPRLRRLLRARLAMLPDGDRALLRVVVAAGRPLPRAVVRRAAGGGDDDGPAMARLRALRLVRTGGPRGDSVECYHDRVLEALAADLDDADRRAVHRAVAEALEAERSDDACALAEHHAAAGDPVRAVDHAVRGARAAAELLAFDRAAETFTLALRYGAELPPERRAALTKERADALTLAGRCAEAAPLYVSAAEHLPAGGAADAERRAAEAFLVSGRVDAGAALLRRLLGRAGLPFPASPAAAALGAFGRLVLLAVRGVRFRERSVEHVPPAELGRVDLCDAAAKGLVAVDNVRGAYFSVRALGLALRVGEPGRVGRALATVGAAVLAPVGGPLGRWGRRLLAAAEQIAARSDDPLLRGAVAVAAGQIHVLAGEWRQALALSDRGVETLADHGAGGAWERSIGRMGSIRALEELGRPAAALLQGPLERRRADDLGDRYAAVTAMLYAAAGRLSVDDPRGARREAEAAMTLWDRSEFDVQRLYALRVLARADLYDGDGARAWARVREAWPRLEASMLLRVPIVRIDARGMRAAAALAAGGDAVATARRDARALAREGRRDCLGHAALIVAGIHARAGRTDAAAEALRHAETAFVRADMSGRSATARYALGVVLGSSGDGLRTEASAALRDRGVVSPARWTAMEAPGIVRR